MIFDYDKEYEKNKKSERINNIKHEYFNNSFSGISGPDIENTLYSVSHLILALNEEIEELKETSKKQAIIIKRLEEALKLSSVGFSTFGI